MKKELKKINNKWVRLAVLIIVAVNSAAMIFDVQLLPYSNEQIVSGLSVIAMFGSEIWNHWKNNSYTDEAQQADNYLESIKGGNN